MCDVIKLCMKVQSNRTIRGWDLTFWTKFGTTPPSILR